MDYMNIVLIGFAVGLIDYTIKEVRDWSDLPNLFKGWTWHITMGSLYIALIVLYAYASGEWIALVGTIGLINEDFFYYLIKSIYNKKIFTNKWLEISFPLYLYLIVLSNIIIIGAFKCSLTH